MNKTTSLALMATAALLSLATVSNAAEAEKAKKPLIDRVTTQLENAPPPGAEEIPVLQQCVAVWDNLAEFVNPKLEAPNPKLPAFRRHDGKS